MSFFNKLKKGVSDTTALAKVTVEVNRLKMQVSSKKKVITELQMNIGNLVYEQFIDSVERQEEISSICTQIQAIYFEIDSIQEKIDELNDEKKCICGCTMVRSSRFCPECGYKFTEEVMQTTERNSELTLALPVEVEAEDISYDLVSDAEEAIQQCPECAETLEPDAKFCGNCGTIIHLA